MKYDLKDLITFSYVAKMKSFTKAAEALGIQKALATNRINGLEKAVGMKLLARTTREVNLTSEGKSFLSYCNPIIAETKNLENFLDSTKKIQGRLKIALPPYFSRYHIVPYLEEFLTEYPDLHLDIVLTENPVNIIAECFDLQIRIQIPEDEGLEVAKLMSNHKIVCASPAYIKRHGKPTKPEDLRKHNCLIFGENNTWKFRPKGKTTSAKDEIVARDLHGNIRCDNGEIIKDLTMSGIGITLKSSRDAEDEIKSGQLVVLLEDYDVVNETEFYAVYPSGNYMSPKIKAFVDFFRAKLQEKERKKEVMGYDS